MKVAVIIPAYKAAKYIEQAVESVRMQRSIHDVELRIGVDGCRETSAKLKRMGVAHYYSPRNVGPYVMRNSLMAIGHADYYVQFCADDVMQQGLIRECVQDAQEGISRPLGIECDDSLTPVGSDPRAIGVICFSDYVRATLGGYKAYRIHSDYDFIERARSAGFHVETGDAPMYFRRNHSGSITASRRGLRSGYHKRVKKQCAQDRGKGQVHIEPVTTKIVRVRK